MIPRLLRDGLGRPRLCRNCGAPVFGARSDRVFCTKACRDGFSSRRQRLRRLATLLPILERACERCGQLFQPTFAAMVLCSIPCAEERAREREAARRARSQKPGRPAHYGMPRCRGCGAYFVAPSPTSRYCPACPAEKNACAP